MTPLAEALGRAALAARLYAKWAQAASEAVPGGHADHVGNLERVARQDLREALDTVEAILAGPDAEATE